MKLLLLKFTAVLLSLILNFSGLNLSPDPDISELPNYGPDIFAETYCVLEGESGAVLLQKDMLLPGHAADWLSRLVCPGQRKGA